MSSAPIYQSIKIDRNKTIGSGESLKSGREKKRVPTSLSPITTKRTRFDSHQTSSPVLDPEIFVVLSDNGSPDEGQPPVPQLADLHFDPNLQLPTISNAPEDGKDSFLHSFRCEGLPQTPNFSQEVCKFIGTEEGETFCMYGAVSIEREAQVFSGRMVCRGCHRLMEPRELDVLRNFAVQVRAEKQQLRLDLLEGRTRTQQRNHIAVQGWQPVREKERHTARRNESEHHWAKYRAKSSIRDANRSDNRSGVHMKDTTQSGITDYSDNMREVLKMAVLVMFQCYPLQISKGVRRRIPKQTLMKLLTDVLQEVGPRYNVTGPLSSDGRIQYREHEFLRALYETLDHVPNTKSWQVKQPYILFVTDGQRPQWHKKKVKEIIHGVVEIVRDELNRFGV